MQYTIPSDIARYARQLGLSDGDNEEVILKIAGMVRSSAPITHPTGNRRFEDWLFLVRRGLVSRVHLIKCQTCDDRKRIDVYNECPRCAGTGCMFCNDSGQKKGMIPCPQCTGN